MSTYKTVSSDYIITVNDGLGNVVINGNLNVEGNVTYVETTELKVLDPFIILNVSNTPGNVSSYYSNSGIITHKTSSTYAGLRYNNNSGQWEISTNTSESGETGSWSALATATASSPGAPENAVQFNVGNTFTGSANLLFDSGNNKFTLKGHEVFGNIGTAPATVANSVALYHNIQGSGGTGLYVKSPLVEDELVSKSASIVFAIIF